FFCLSIRLTPRSTLFPYTTLFRSIPTSNGKFVVVVNIDEYDKKTGLLLSSTMFETMFTINLCSNTQPKDTVIAEWLPGNATQINQNSFEFCNIDSNSFTGKVFDENPNDSLIISSNISPVLPSGNMLMTYAHPNRYDTALVTFF